MSGITIKHLIYIIIGVLLVALGILLLTATVDVARPSIWLPTLLILAGVFVLPVTMSPTNEDQTAPSPNIILVAIVLVGAGIFMLLRDFGIVTVPWLRYGMGAFFVVMGIYSIILGMKPMFHSKRSTQRDVN